ncbi:MAG: FadR family transcriptional regulator [Bauldia sp.]|nr:FadR family transcriptional regulator [Bauldia sp.]
MDDRDVLTTIEAGQRRLPDIIAERIVGLIRGTPLQAGDRLAPETELARQLGVGRTSVREALQKLQTLGIVEVVRGRGVFVSEPNVDDAQQAFARWSKERLFALEELLETRMSIEASAAALASGRATTEEIDQLESLNLDHLAAARSGKLAEIVSTDQKFHEALIASGHNRLLARFYGMLVAELTDFRRKTLARPGVPERSAAQHAAIVAAIRARNPRAARRAAIDHLWVLYEEIDAAALGVRETASAFTAREALD